MQVVKETGASLLVRHEVVRLIQEARGQSIRLPSSTEMARQLSVSQRTVAAEYKRLTDENWVYGIPGVGTFTRPRREYFYREAEHIRNIGIGIGNGLFYAIPRPLWEVQMQCGLKLYDSLKAQPHPIQFTNTNSRDFHALLKAGHYDGLLWLQPSPLVEESLQKLHRDGMPVVTLFTESGSLPSVVADYAETGAMLTDALFRKGCRRIWWLMNERYFQMFRPGIDAVYRREDLPREEIRFFDSPERFVAEFQTALRENRPPEGVYMNWARYCRNRLPEGWRGDDPAKCLWCFDESMLSAMPDLREITFRYRSEEMAAEAVKLLWDQIDGADLGAVCRRIPKSIAYHL